MRRKKIYVPLIAAMTAVLTIALGAVAVADTLNVNDLVTHGNTSVVQGGSGSAEVYLMPQDSADPVGGCNATGANPVTVTLTSGNTSAIADPGTVILVGCGTDSARTKGYSVSSTATVGTVVTINGVASGGKVAGTFTTDSFTVTVTAAPVIDSTPPVITKTVTGTAGLNGWYTSDVTVAWSVTDLQSAVVIDSGCGTQNFTSETTGVVSSCSAHSVGGAASDSVTIKIDKTGPSATLAAAGTLGLNGWYTSNVTISTSGSDLISNPTTCTPDQSQTTDTTGATFNGSCTNAAGLTTNATPLTIKRDATKPYNVAFTDGSITDGASYYFGSVPAGPTTCTADDATSGLASCVVSGGGTSVGPHSYVATATDNAGNLDDTTTLSYTVLAWTLNGFYAPVDMNGVFNVVKGGSTVPLKFEIFAGSTELTDVGAVSSLKYSLVTCDATAPLDTIETLATGGTVLRYDTTAGQFIYNWKTPVGAGKCYSVVMKTADGSSLAAFFKVK